MIQTRIIPVTTPTSEELLVEITEKVCRPFCILGDAQPTATVTFTAGEVTVTDGNAIFPVTAMVTVVSPSSSGCGCAQSQVFREHFQMAFNATGTNTITLLPGSTVLVKPAYQKCCKAHGVHITATLTAEIA